MLSRGPLCLGPAQLVVEVPARQASAGAGLGAAGALSVLEGNRQGEGGRQKGCLEQCSPTRAGLEEGSWAGLSAWTWSRHPPAGQQFPKGRRHGGSQASVGGARGSVFGFDCGGALPSPGSRHPSRAAVPALLVGPQEPGHLGAQQFDEGARKHLLGLLGRVLEVVLGVCQHVKEGLDQLLVLQNTARPSVRGLWPGWGGRSSGHLPLQPPGALKGSGGVCRDAAGLAGGFQDPTGSAIQSIAVLIA